MPNPFYNHSNGIPITQSRGASAAIRSELDGVAAGFDGVKAIQDAQAITLTTKANKAGDTYTGAQNFTGATVTAPTKTIGDSSAEVATTAFIANALVLIANALALKANLASPGLTGNPTAPTAAFGDNSTQIATTVFVAAAILASAGPLGSVPVWVSGASYVIGNCVFSPINAQTYRRTINGSGTTDPSADSSNWTQVGAGTPDFLLFNLGVI